ncbi:metallophosphoesterase family protein [Sphingomonas morindae]|uniref:Metallophosphoesterase family protein n=1 Tax=Sphingomonas morindae TaxID=1541170 RepID=A0ABY4X697_9SPHN|nr:metallophosphoesterase family protein [Sphingomonas morindae]USI72401.1 metallophosphoesterase family protein [Sphingomonas morindae]
MTLYFTADTHFGDHRTLNIHKRGFGSVAEMDAALIAGWNAVVTPADTVWHLGDVARSGASVAAWLARLNGTKYLVTGNNDDADTAAAPGWAGVSAYAELVVEDRLCILCHYPFRTWHNKHRGAINLHGHSHGRLAPMPRQFDVGVDARGFRPVTLAALLEAG